MSPLEVLVLRRGPLHAKKSSSSTNIHAWYYFQSYLLEQKFHRHFRLSINFRLMYFVCSFNTIFHRNKSIWWVERIVVQQEAIWRGTRLIPQLSSHVYYFCLAIRATSHRIKVFWYGWFVSSMFSLTRNIERNFTFQEDISSFKSWIMWYLYK